MPVTNYTLRHVGLETESELQGPTKLDQPGYCGQVLTLWHILLN